MQYVVMTNTTTPSTLERRRRPVDANARPANGIALFRWSAPAASNPSVCADNHVPGTGRRLGALPAGLWQQRVGQRPSLPLAPTPVGAERGGTADLPPECSDRITDALVSLHWLRVPERIQYKVAVLAYQVLHGSAP